MTEGCRFCYLNWSDWANTSSWRPLGIGSDSLRFTVTLVKHYYQPRLQPSHNGPTGSKREPVRVPVRDSRWCPCLLSLCGLPPFSPCLLRLCVLSAAEMSPTGGCARRKERAALEPVPWQLFSLCVWLWGDRGRAETEIIDPRLSRCDSHRREGARSDGGPLLRIALQPAGEKQQHMIPLKSPACGNINSWPATVPLTGTIEKENHLCTCIFSTLIAGRQIWVSELCECSSNGWWIGWVCSGAARLPSRRAFSLTVVMTNMKALTHRQTKTLGPSPD